VKRCTVSSGLCSQSRISCTCGDRGSAELSNGTSCLIVSLVSLFSFDLPIFPSHVFPLHVFSRVPQQDTALGRPGILSYHEFPLGAVLAAALPAKLAPTWRKHCRQALGTQERDERLGVLCDTFAVCLLAMCSMPALPTCGLWLRPFESQCH